MRVYFQFEDKEYTSLLDFNKLANKMTVIFFEKTKYKIMWSLITLEKEIDEQEGVIIVDDKDHITMKDFTEELADRMFELIKLEFDRP
jgi:hypothetical protein